MEEQWKKLVSMALRTLQEQGNGDAVFVIKNGHLIPLQNSYDNWNGGIYYWDLKFELKYRDFQKIVEKKDDLEGEIQNAIETLYFDDRDYIANVLIRPAIEKYIDWSAVLPETKESIK